MRAVANRRLVACAAAVAGLVAGCSSPGLSSPLRPLERRLVYYPAGPETGDWQPSGLEFEDAWFEAADGTRLHGWFLPCERPRGVVLFAHGNAGNLTLRTGFLRKLRERHDVAVMAFDYRGYGKSEGRPSESGLLQDARAARRWLARRTGVGERDVILIGRSLGGGVAVDLAARDGARALVLINTFTSLPDVARRLLPVVPVTLVMSDRYDSISKIADYSGPLLVAHGDADGLVPYELGRRLFDAAPGPKRFVTIAGGDHNTPMTGQFHEAFGKMLAGLNAP